MTFGLQFGVDQRPVHADLELASVRGNESHGRDVRLELLEQFICQANGPVGVMSDRAVKDFNI